MNILGVLKGLGLGDIVEKGAKAVDDMIVTGNELELEKIKADAEAVKAEMENAGKQIEVNREAAKHSSRFVAGARPFLLWICGAAFAYTFIVGPLVEQLFGMPMVKLDMGPLMTVLFGMLGLAGYRTIEKGWGTARERIRGD